LVCGAAVLASGVTTGSGTTVFNFTIFAVDVALRAMDLSDVFSCFA
jgi:hypothetical protein